MSDTITTAAATEDATNGFALAAWTMIVTLEKAARDNKNVWRKDAIMAPNGTLITVEAISAVNDVINRR